MPLGTEVGLRDIVLDHRWAPSSPSPKGAQPRIFGQCPLWPTAGLTKMPVGMEVGLGPGDFLLHGLMGTQL